VDHASAVDHASTYDHASTDYDLGWLRSGNPGRSR